MSDPEALLRAKGTELSTMQLRRFSLICCRRIAYICNNPIYTKMLELIDEACQYHAGVITRDRLLELHPEYNRVYQELYPGYGTPKADTLALVAVGEASRESALDAAISASSTAAEAKASSAAAAVGDAQYDEVYEAAFQDERQAQFEVLRQLDPSCP